MDPLLLLAAVVAVVWGAVLFVRGGLLGGCLAVLAAGICFGYPLWSLPGGPLPVTIDRVAWLLLVLQYFVWRRLGAAAPKPLATADYVLFAFFGVLIVSTLSHDWQYSRSLPASRLVFFYLMPLGMYWVARNAPITERAVNVLGGALTVFGVYLAITAIGEAAGVAGIVFPAYITSAGQAEFLGRARGPLLNPAGNGILLGTCLAAAWLWLSPKGRADKGALAVLTPLMAAGVFCTLTRSAWIGATLGMLACWLMLCPPRWRARLVAAVALTGVALGLANWERIVSLKRDTQLDAAAAADSVNLRPILAAVAWQMILDRPLLGCGLGHYMEASPEYVSDRSGDLPLEKARPFEQHNVVLSLLTETGVVGGGLFVWLLGLWVRDAWRLRRADGVPPWARRQAALFLVLVVNYAVNGMFQDVSIIVMIHMVLFFMAGLNAGLAPLAASQPAPQLKLYPAAA